METRPIKAQASDFSQLGSLKTCENQSLAAARRPANKINTCVSYDATRSSPLVASTARIPPFHTSLCSLFPRHNDSLPPQPAGLPSLPRRLAARAGLTSVSTRKSKSERSRLSPRTCAALTRTRSVTVGRRRRKIRWPLFFTPIHMRRF